jgi:hypothetical protein
MCTASGPGSAALAQNWADTFGLTNVHVWGDTTDYVFNNFAGPAPINGSYPNVMVVEFDTMTLDFIGIGGLDQVGAYVAEILDTVDDCADLP